jgi:heme/copper-type cytochrome/quinol oxidase subunit 2
VKRFATFETSSHFKFFDDFASKASISFDVVVVVALLLVVVVLRFLLRVFVLSFVFLRAVIKGGTDGDDDFDEQQHVFVERVVAVVKVVIIITKSLSLSSFYSQTKKKATFREREFAFKRERKRKSRVFVSAAAEKCVSRFESVCYYMMRVCIKKVSLVFRE